MHARPLFHCVGLTGLAINLSNWDFWRSRREFPPFFFLSSSSLSPIVINTVVSSAQAQCLARGAVHYLEWRALIRISTLRSRIDPQLLVLGTWWSTVLDMSSLTTAVTAACVGAAVCAGVYVIWGPDHFFRKKGIVMTTWGEYGCLCVIPCSHLSGGEFFCLYLLKP